MHHYYEASQAYLRVRELPFPSLGKRVGDFPLFDSLLAGIASRAAEGELIRADDVPTLDAESRRMISELREKLHLSEEEKYFLLYFRHLEALSDLLCAD